MVTWRLVKLTTEFTKDFRGSKKAATLFHTLPCHLESVSHPRVLSDCLVSKLPPTQSTNMSLTTLLAFSCSSPSLPWSPSSQAPATVKQDTHSCH